ncbi:MAG TPA: cytochrome c [Rhodanobacteraceae bacterium]|jgi:mono/diheme cytochrome c family protein|nr:cytochrome c [Rhodanobacteraceae bacterium]
MRFIGALIFWIVIAIIAYFVVAFTGAYQVGADVPHWGITRHAIGFLREHTIERRVADIKPPPLDDPALVKLGAQHYAEMCVGCHLAPGMGHSDLRDGLYPKPPNLTRFAPDPAEAFWIIKHGLKMTAMPAWGATHDDHTIWAMVAYLQKQPRMSVDEFRTLTANASAMGGHEGMPASGASTPAPASTAAPASASSTH